MKERERREREKEREKRMADPSKNKGFGKKFKLPGGKKKANKDISGPRNFRQLTHIGYNKDTGEFEVGLYVYLYI